MTTKSLIVLLNMNLSNVLKNAFSIFKGPLQNFFAPLREVWENATSGRYLNALMNKETGAALTPAEREANEFTHNERIEAQDWSAEREDTEMQRRVADYQAAGLNPMMLAGGSGVSSSSSGGQSVSPSGGSLGDILQLALLGPQMDVLKAQAKNLEASATEKGTKSGLNEAKTRLTDKQIEQVAQSIAESRKRCEKIDNDMVRNEALNALAYAEAHLAEVNAEDLTQLRASRIALNEAREKEAKAAAALAHTNNLYQAGLIQEGMPHAVVQKIMAEKNLADAEKRGAVAKAITNEIINGRMTGSFTATIDKILREQGIESHSASDAIIGALFNFADAVNITL